VVSIKRKSTSESADFERRLFGDGQISLDWPHYSLLAYGLGLNQRPDTRRYVLADRLGWRAAYLARASFLRAETVLSQLKESDGDGFFALTAGRVLVKK